MLAHKFRFAHCEEDLKIASTELILNKLDLAGPPLVFASRCKSQTWQLFWKQVTKCQHISSVMSEMLVQHFILGYVMPDPWET